MFVLSDLTGQTGSFLGIGNPQRVKNFLERPSKILHHEFGVPEYIIDYKLEALELRNYSVATVELPPFEKVFRGWG